MKKIKILIKITLFLFLVGVVWLSVQLLCGDKVVDYDQIPIEAIDFKLSASLADQIVFLGCHDGDEKIMPLPALGFIYTISDEAYGQILETEIEYDLLWQYFDKSLAGNNRLITMRLARILFLKDPAKFQEKYFDLLTNKYSYQKTALIVLAGYEAFTLCTTTKFDENKILTPKYREIAEASINSDEFKKYLRKNSISIFLYFSSDIRFKFVFCVPSLLVKTANQVSEMQIQD